MLGLNKWFVIIIFVALAIWYGTKNWLIAVQIVIAYIVIRIVWRFATR